MNQSVPFQKTAKGEEEIFRRCHGLAPRARSLLIMVNGKLAGEQLMKRGESFGGGTDLFQLLVDGGYIEPSATATDSPEPGTHFSSAHAETIKFASHFIVETLGPAYDELGGRVEACRDAAQLAILLEGIREVIDSNAGKKKAEAFWAGVMARLS